MCGICGLVVAERGAGPDREPWQRMSGRLVHRGPDSDGLLRRGAGRARGPAALDHRPRARRPADLATRTAASPSSRTARSTTTASCARELERRGHRFRTDCDTEVLVHLYEERGRAFVERAARHVRDRPLGRAPQRRLLLARDRFGIKPLYYRRAAATLSFASELKAMLEQPGFSREIDPDALAAYLAFNSIPAPLTIFARGAQAARRATCSTGRTARSSVPRYARPRPAAAGERARGGRRASSPASCASACATRVRAHLVADVPVGVLLSGGVDSGGARRARRAASRRAGADLLDRLRGGGFDELERARLVAERYGTDHHELRPAPRRRRAAAEAGRGVRRALRRLLGAAHLPRLPARRRRGQGRALRRGRRRAVRRLLHLRRRPARPARRPPRARSPRPLVEALPSSVGEGQLRLQGEALRPRRGACRRWSATTPGRRSSRAAARAALLARRRRGWDPLDLYRERYAETEGAEPLARLQDVDLGIYLVDDLLVKTDRSSMAHSLELRVPFLDPSVAELRPGAADRATRSAASPRSACCGGRSPRCCRGRSSAAASRASRSRWPPGCGGRCEPFAREVLSPETLERQGCLDPAAVPPMLDAPLLRARGPQPPALGPDGLHPLVRPLRVSWARRVDASATILDASSPSCSRASSRCSWCR